MSHYKSQSSTVHSPSEKKTVIPGPNKDLVTVALSPVASSPPLVKEWLRRDDAQEGAFLQRKIIADQEDISEMNLLMVVL
jgi:hypothetical protein